MLLEADPGISGRTFKRPAVQRLMQAVEGGKVDVIVLWKVSRLSRARLDWAVAVDRVEQLGGRIESATEPVDVTTSTGRLARGMLAEFAAFESERIGDTWRETHARRVRDGLPINGKPRFGYRSVNKRFEQDEKEAPVLADLYRRYIAGESFFSLVKWLNAEGWQTVPGYGTPGPWTQVAIRRVLDSGFGAGLVTVRGQKHPGGHEPVISEHEWKRYQSERKKRGHGTGSGERSTYLLSGLIWCACGAKMNGGKFGSARTPKYRCEGFKHGTTHTGAYVMAEYVERAVREWVEGLDLQAPAPTARPRRDVEAAAREIDALDRQLTELTRHLASGLVPEVAYRSARDEIDQQRERLTERLREAEVEAARPAVTEQQMRDIARDWEALPTAQLRAMLKEVIARVVVTGGRPRGRVEIQPRW